MPLSKMMEFVLSLKNSYWSGKEMGLVAVHVELAEIHLKPSIFIHKKNKKLGLHTSDTV